MKPENFVTSIRELRNGVMIQFYHGQALTLIPFRSQGEKIEGISTISVIQQSTDRVGVFGYVGRKHKYLMLGDSDPQEHTVRVALGVTQQEVAQLWQIAKDYVINKYNQLGSSGQSAFWPTLNLIVNQGEKDFQALKAGTAPTLAVEVS